jgi:transketolase
MVKLFELTEACKLNTMDKELELKKLADYLRRNSLKLALGVGKSGSHLGGGLSLIEVFAALYGGGMVHNSKDPKNENRDRLIVSKGHCVLPYYSVLSKFGFLTKEEIDAFETNGALLHGHATRYVEKGIEFSGGSLGLGISYAIGVALACKLNNQKYHVFTIIGDGECNEGIVWEAVMSASHYKLDNLTIIVDNNKLQYDGNPEDVMNMGSLAEKFKVFGLHTLEINGHDVYEVYNAFTNRVKDKPNAIIANTIKGKGVSFMEDKKEWHHSVLSQEQYDLAISEQPIY